MSRDHDHDRGRPRRRARAQSLIVVGILLAVVVAPITLPFASAPASAQQGGENSTAGIVVRQGDACYPLQAFSNESASVSEFYGYRSPFTEPSGWYHAYGPAEDLLREDTSQVLLYNGSDGLSLVFLHDGVSNTTGSGGTVTMDISGLPAEGNWSVQDDSYRGQDDVFEVGGSDAHIEWYWNEGNRSDGGAYTGLGGSDWEEITVEPRFNEQSPGYPFEKWDGPPESNQVDSWVARSANGTSYELDMSEPITVTRGPCDAEPPTASLSANRTDLTPGARVTLDASGSADNDAIASYRWDLDGDGTIDTTTNESALTTAYNRTGDYSAQVTVVDRANNTANASVSLQVQEETTATTTTTSTTTATEGTDSTNTGSGGDETTDGTSAPTTDGGGGSGVNDDVQGAIDRASEALSGMDDASLIGLVVLAVALVVIGLVVLRR